MIASGISQSANVRSPAIPRRTAIIASNPLAWPESEILRVSATVSGVNVSRMAASMPAASRPSASHVATIAPMLEPLT